MSSGTFGNVAPLQKHTAKPKPKYSTPAPGNYSTVATDKVKHSKAASSSFGGPLAKQSRPKTGYLVESYKFKAPGPGNYNINGSLGKQQSSLKTSSANNKFSTATRDQQAATYMPDLQQEGSSRMTPGPGSYTITNHNSISRKSGKKKAASYSFGGNLAKVKREGLAGKSALCLNAGRGLTERRNQSAHKSVH